MRHDCPVRRKDKNVNTLTLTIGNGGPFDKTETRSIAAETDLHEATVDVGELTDLSGFFASVEQKAYRIAMYALRDDETALDVVQDAMLKLVEKYRDRPHPDWAPLFFTILNNRITDVRRWRMLREVGGKLVSLFKTRDDDEDLDLLDSGVGTEIDSRQPEQEALGSQIRNHLDQALSRLSERQRQVFLLREWQGFNVKETAKILGCSEGSVKQHHFRAMQALRSDLAEVWNNE